MFALQIYKKSAVWVLKIDIFFDFSIVLRLKGGIFVAQKTKDLWIGKRYYHYF